MCSFGEGVRVTPLQLGALMASIANGGTLFYLQHPLTPNEVRGFRPVVKRYLNIGSLVPEMSEGLFGRHPVRHGAQPAHEFYRSSGAG